ncbi:dynein, axonemal, heavy chain 1, partial [Dunaliella salina]
GGGAGEGSNASVAAVVADILARLPPDFDLEVAQQKFPVSYHQSMNQVLITHTHTHNRLTHTHTHSLINLDKALQGLQVLSSELEGVLRALAIGRVPRLWQATSFPSLKPLAGYIKDLMARLDMLSTWYKKGQPSVFWISGFFFTPSFTTAVLQNYARKHQLPIDSIGFDFEMMKGDAASLEGSVPEGGGVYVQGLFMEGAAWDNEAGLMKESEPKALHAPAPIIWLRPQQLADIHPPPHYDCPVYRTTDRRGTLATTGHSTNFLMMVRLPSDKPQWHWILRGVCMLCSLTDD